MTHSDLLRISSERADILLNPFKSLGLIIQTEVDGSFGLAHKRGNTT
jgi:hypothetical protein